MFARGRSQNLDNFYELFHAAVPRENRLKGEQLDDDAPGRPHVYLAAVGGRIEDEFGRAIVPRTNIRDVVLLGLDDLGRAEVADLDLEGVGVDQDVWGLEVAVADVVELDREAVTSR